MEIAFALCDRDGNGSLDASELKVVLRSIFQREPSESEVSNLMNAMDINKNGTIELEEFKSVMSHWLSNNKKKRNREDIEEERKDVHNVVKNFFSSNSEPINLEEVEMKLKKNMFAVGLNDNIERNDTIITSMSQIISISNKTKYEALTHSKNCLSNFKVIIEGFASNNLQRILSSLENLYKLVMLVEIFSTPLERRSIANVLIKTYEFIEKGDILTYVAKILENPISSQLLIETLKFLTLYFPGPRIASFPVGHILHPSSMYFKNKLKTMGLLKHLISFLSHQDEKVREEACAVIGSYVSYNYKCRDEILLMCANDFMKQTYNLLSRLLDPRNSLPCLQKASFTISSLCGNTHSPKHFPNLNHILPFFSSLANLFLNSSDELVLRNISDCFKIILPGFNSTSMICDRLIVLLGWTEYPNIVFSIVDVIKEIIYLDENQTKYLLSKNLVEPIKGLLKSKNENLRLSGCDLIVSLASRCQVKELIEENLFKLLLDLLITDDYLKWKISKCILKITETRSPQVIVEIVKKNAIKQLSNAFTHFKVYDNVLSQVYKYCGATFNFDFMNDILSAIDNILEMGDLISSERKEINSFALFDLGIVDKIHQLLKTIKENSPEDINAWRLNKEQTLTLEQLIARIFSRVKRAHDMNATDNISRVISEKIVNIWKEFQSLTIQQLNQTKLLMKSKLGIDARMNEVDSNITFPQLKDVLQRTYNRALILGYLDQEGSFITIASQEDFNLYHKLINQQNKKYLEIELKSDETHDFFYEDHSKKRKIDFTNQNLNSPPLQRQSREENTPTQFTLNQNDMERIRTLEQQQQILELSKTFKLEPQVVINLLQQFRTFASKNGKIDLVTFSKVMKESIGITDELQIEQQFNSFDENGDGQIDFREFILVCSIKMNGSLDERIKLMFNSYDVDKNGSLDKGEFFKILKYVLSVIKKDISNEEIAKLVEQYFNELDSNKDGKIDFEEFSNAIKQKGLFKSYFYQK